MQIETSAQPRSSDLSERQAPRSVGSGVFIDPDGTLVTNAHVVRGATAVRVRLVDGRNFEASVLGIDNATDLAVLRVQAPEPFKAAKLRADVRAEVGEWVLAIGNPLGLGHAVTAGIVSGRGRAARIATYENFIQTDAAINPGNSGGPLVDLDGNIVGINTAVADTRNGSQGIGFAIPAWMVAEVVEELVENGRVRRGYLGVELREFEGAQTKRVVVTRAVRNSPARAAGVRAGDQIVTFDGEKIAVSYTHLTLPTIYSV